MAQLGLNPNQPGSSVDASAQPAITGQEQPIGLGEQAHKLASLLLADQPGGNDKQAELIPKLPQAKLDEVLNVLVDHVQLDVSVKLLLAKSRNAAQSAQHPISQFFRAATVAQLPNGSSLVNTIQHARNTWHPSGAKQTSAQDLLCSVIQDVTLKHSQAIFAEQASTPRQIEVRSGQLKTLANFSKAFVQELNNNGALPDLGVSTLETLTELFAEASTMTQHFDEASSAAFGQLQADCNGALAMLAEKYEAIINLQQSTDPFGTFRGLPDYLQQHADVAIAAVGVNGYILEELNDTLKNNFNVVRAAVANAPESLSLASPELQNNKSIVRLAFQGNENMFRHAGDTLKNDKEFVRELAETYPSVIAHASEQVKGDYDLMKSVIARDGNLLDHASDELKGNRELVELAIQTAPHAFFLASSELQRDPEVRRLAGKS